MYEFELPFGVSRIHMRKEEDPNETKHEWDSSTHNHAGYELHVLLRGAAKVDVEGQSHILPQHHVMLIAPGQYHRPIPMAGEFERFSFSFTVSEGPLLQALQAAVPVCRVYPATADILSVCRDVFYEFSAENAFSHIMLQSHLTRLLVCNFRLLNIAYDARSADGLCRDMRLTHLIDYFFESHLTEGAYVEALAEELHLSRSQLNRLLKEYYGMTFREKLLRTRMDQAAWLLRHTDQPVDEIAEAVGYRSQSAFYKVFRDRYAVTPEKYRRRLRKE